MVNAHGVINRWRAESQFEAVETAFVSTRLDDHPISLSLVLEVTATTLVRIIHPSSTRGDSEPLSSEVFTPSRSLCRQLHILEKHWIEPDN